MKKILLLIVLLPTVLKAQVGIGTANPLADLHIAGDTSTVRIESLSARNNPVYNDGTTPSFTFVTARGDVTLDPSINNGTGPGGITSPINFLLTDHNFIPDGVSNRGTIINNDTNTTVQSGPIAIVPFSSISAALIEVKYGITALLSSTDLNTDLTPFNDVSARAFKIYFFIDINDDGLDSTESERKFGLNGQCYASNTQGILGYSYTNGHGYTTIPAGNHSLHFYAEIIDGNDKYTSIGFGGDRDFLRVRIYN